MQKLPLTRFKRLTLLLFTEQSLLHSSNVTRGSHGAELVYPSCSNVEVKVAALSCVPSLCETCFLVDKYVDEFPGTDAIFAVKKCNGQWTV